MIVVLGRGRCGSSAVAWALKTAGIPWEGEGEPDKSVQSGAQFGYLDCLSVPERKDGWWGFKMTNILPDLPDDAKVIHLTRQLEKQAASIYNASIRAPIDELRDSVLEYDDAVRKKYKTLELRFEDLIADPIGTFEKIKEYIGGDWEPEVAAKEINSKWVTYA